MYNNEIFTPQRSFKVLMITTEVNLRESKQKLIDLLEPEL